MKLSILIVSIILLAQNSWSDNKHLLDQIVSIAEQQPTKGRDPYVFRYNSKKFNVFKEYRSLQKDYNDRAQKNGSDCRYVVNFGRHVNIWTLRFSSRVQNAKEITDILTDLLNKEQLKSILTVRWDQQSGRPEECDIYEINAYTVDGYVLTMEFK